MISKFAKNPLQQGLSNVYTLEMLQKDLFSKVH